MKEIITCCPRCDNETFVVNIRDSGTDPGTVNGPPNHWFSGEGICSECGYEDESYSDGSI